MFHYYLSALDSRFRGRLVGDRVGREAAVAPGAPTLRVVVVAPAVAVVLRTAAAAAVRPFVVAPDLGHIGEREAPAREGGTPRARLCGAVPAAAAAAVVGSVDAAARAASSARRWAVAVLLTVL